MDDLSGATRRALADAVRGVVGERKTVTSGTGTYVRTDPDGTGWVLMAGADEPTPVNGRALIDAEPGDSVQWALEGTALSITGNATTPAVGTRQVTREVAPVAERAEAANETAEQAIEDAAEAATTATKYVTDLGDDGIWVTPEDAKPEDGAAVATTSGWHIADALELWRKGASVFRVWFDDLTETVKMRLGSTGSWHIVMDDDSIDFADESEAVGASFNADGFSTKGGMAELYSESSIRSYSGERIYKSSTELTHMGKAGPNGQINYSKITMGTSGAVDDDDELTSSMSKIELNADRIYAYGDFVYNGVELFSGSYADTRASAVTLSESAANFSLLHVFCQDGDGQVTSVDVHEPNGKTFAVTMSTATQQYLYVKSKSFAISGTSITCAQSGGTYRHGQARLGSSGVTWDQSAEMIGVVRVVGFR